jgi:hypothetical protein
MTDEEHSTVESAAVRYWMRAVSEAAMPFESRWTWASLKRIDPDVYRRVREQCDLFGYELGTGSLTDIEAHGAATCRGYARAFQVLGSAAEPDNAYQLGQDPKTGLQVAIGQQRAAAERVRELHGESVAWITPDEVAMLLANLEAFKPISLSKRLFPGAEMVSINDGGGGR